jgi:aromatic-L-amino-acid/L-tryptophan decarboxylase
MPDILDGFALDRPTGSVVLPSDGERQYHVDGLTQTLVEAANRVAQGSVVPDFDPELFGGALTRFDFSTALPVEAPTSWTIVQLEHGVIHRTHPRCLGLFKLAPTFPAKCAVRIGAACNPQRATAMSSPAAVATEVHVIATVAPRVGLQTGCEGHFTKGGAQANIVPLICALTTASDGFAGHRTCAFPGQPAAYISPESHLAWFRIADQPNAARITPALAGTHIWPSRRGASARPKFNDVPAPNSRRCEDLHAARIGDRCPVRGSRAGAAQHFGAVIG